jgi:hypothetical protein
MHASEELFQVAKNKVEQIMKCYPYFKQDMVICFLSPVSTNHIDENEVPILLVNSENWPG